MLIPPCYFYVDDSNKDNPIIATLCQECGKNWPNAHLYTGSFGPWEYKCSNPICNKLIWKGEVDSNLP